jgi:hypothetical protein
MADPNFLTYQFSQQVPKTTLTDLSNRAVGIHQQQEAARIQRNNEITYDQLLQQYMTDPNEYNLMALNQAAIPLGLTDQTRAAVQETVQIREQRAAAELLAQQQAAFQEARMAFKNEPSRENLETYMTAAGPLGLFDQVLQGTERLTEIELQENLDELARIVGPLRGDRPDLAIEEAKKIQMALANDGQDEEAAGFQALIDTLEEGDYSTAQELLGAMASALGERGLGLWDASFKFGEEALEAREQRRREIMTEADIVKIANDLEFATEADKARATDEAADLPYGIGQAIIDLASVRSMLTSPGSGGFTVDDLFSREENLRKEYDAYVRPYEIVVDQFDVLYKLSNGWNNPNGVSDQAYTTLFNKLLDPNSVVRQSEADMTANAQAMMDKMVATAQGWFDAGQKFSPEMRETIMETAAALNDVAQHEIDRERDRIERTTTELDAVGSIFGLQGTTTDRVFPDVVDVETRRRNRDDMISYIASGYVDQAAVRLELEGMSTKEIEEAYKADAERWRAGTPVGQLVPAEAPENVDENEDVDLF